MKNTTTKKAGTFTTCQAMSAALLFAAKELKTGEDVRKVYPIEGTGRGGRWLSLKICLEIDNAETGEPIREVWAEVWKSYDQPTKSHRIKAAKFYDSADK